MNRRAFMCLAATGAVAALTNPGIASQVRMEVYKDPSCGCCGAWASAMRDADFNVVIHEDEAVASVKARLGIPASMQGCHTAVTDDYFFEGHVPIEAVEKVLSQRPQLAGLAVPGMPAGSLGMGDDLNASYDVFSLSKGDMRPSVFMRFGKA